MNEYLLLFRGGDARNTKQSPEKWQKHMQKWMIWMENLKKEEKLIDAQPLDNSGGKVISGTKKVVSDGPYMEGKEIVGGYLACRAESYEEAVDIAMGCPILEHDGIVEIRAIEKLEG